MAAFQWGLFKQFRIEGQPVLFKEGRGVLSCLLDLFPRRRGWGNGDKQRVFLEIRPSFKKSEADADRVAMAGARR